MPRRDIEFQTSDHVTLRGWFYRPASSRGSAKLPCLVMAHGWSALKEMGLSDFAERFTSHLPLTCLVYDNRGYGASDAKEGAPRHEIVPSLQQSDYSDAITYAQTFPEVDATRIGIWGSSYSGGHVLFVGAVDRRVKAVLCQCPLANGWDNFHRLIRPDFVASMDQAFADDRLGRARGKDPVKIPVVNADPTAPSALPTAESYKYFMEWEKKCDWKNEVTLRSVEMFRANDPSHLVHRIAPTPLLMTIADNDTLVPTDIALEAYSRAREPKQIHLVKGGHFDGYSGASFEINVGRQVEFLRETLCALAE